jgi:biopolymer transport protein ExbD
MKIKTRNHFAAEVATSSLNDIMFFLLLFFLIISTITNPNVIKVLLPKTSASQVLSRQPIILTITKDKVYYINKRVVAENLLEDELMKACKGLEEPTVVVHAESSLSIQDLVSVMQVGAKNKIRMVLATTTH